ncbi:MAG: hypothetical protein R3C09_14280 [Pirellulaceae bacterium]|jgi:hypothetical protein
MAIVCAATTSLCGQGPDAPVQQHIAQLVGQLGATDFDSREQATAELLSQGEVALPRLRAVPNSAPYEVRHRARLIQQQIEDDKFRMLSRSFLLDLDGSKSYGLPGWDRYRQLVGSTRTCKLLFLDMIRQQPEVAQLIELASAENASPAAASSLAKLASMEASRLRDELYLLREPKIGDSVAMLMVAATLSSQTPVEISDIISISERRSFEGNIHKEGYRNCLRKLLGAWLPKTHVAMAPAAMDCALNYDLVEGSEIARRCLTANFDYDTRKLAFYCLARFGNETDVERIAPFLEDRAVVDQIAIGAPMGEVHESNTPPPFAPAEPVSGNNLVVRINDLALVTSILLLGENPQQVFPRYEEHDKLGFFIHSLASPADADVEQQQRIDQWKQRHLPPSSKS